MVAKMGQIMYTIEGSVGDVGFLAQQKNYVCNVTELK